jgi:hypothetical protein
MKYVENHSAKAPQVFYTANIILIVSFRNYGFNKNKLLSVSLLLVLRWLAE